jgi:hypothetical protein
MSATVRVRLGDWTCPSGNNVQAFLDQGVLEMAWDTPPPLSPIDEAFYHSVIRPDVVRLAKEYSERTGRVLVVTL